VTLAEKKLFTVSEHGTELSNKNIKKIIYTMLQEIVMICEENGICYYLSGGTLLGAIRHQGFIPWDDDIDINIPRPDCEKLMRISKEKLKNSILIGASEDNPTGCEYWRVYDFNTIVFDSGGENLRTYPLFIDIFPIDGLPSSFIGTKIFYFIINCIRKMMRISKLDKWSKANTKGAYIFHVLVGPIIKKIGYKKWFYLLQKVQTHYGYEESAYVGVTTCRKHTIVERVKKEVYGIPVKVQFEGSDFNAPADYNTYLMQLYGDYMKIPSIEKQVSVHEFKCYMRKGEV